MRVTHVITRLIVGGAQENTVASVLGLARKPDLEVDLVAGPSLGPEGSLESFFLAESGRLTVMPELVRPVRPLKDWVALRRLREFFRARRPDVVHTHSGKAGILGRIAAARAGVPIIIHTIHGPSFGTFQGALANAVFEAAERYAAKLTTHFVVVADAMREKYLAAGIGRADRYTKILSGFRLEPFLEAKNDPGLRARVGIGRDDLVIGKIARLTALKGHDDLFEIAPGLVRGCPEIKFLLVGDGEWRGRFEARARALGLEQHFIFAGLVRPETVPQWVGIMDVVTHLSMREGLARALPQGLAAGKPVVAYDCDGAKEVCRDNETGYLVRPGDREGLLQRLAELCRDKALRERLGACGREIVRERFSSEQMVESLYDLYQRLARGPAGSYSR